MLLNMVMFKVTICDLKNKDRNMADITEKTGNGELVTNRDQLVGVDNIEPLIKIIRGRKRLRVYTLHNSKKAVTAD